MADLKSPDDIIRAADEEIESARRLEATLEDAVRNGDESVEPEQIEKARGLKRFAELRREAAQKKAARLAELQAEADFKALLDEHVTGAEGLLEQVDPLLAQARELIDQALALTRDHDRHVLILARAAKSEGNEWRPEDDPELVGNGQLSDWAWFKARGVRGEVLGAGGVLTRLLKPYEMELTSWGRFSKLKEAL